MVGHKFGDVHKWLSMVSFSKIITNYKDGGDKMNENTLPLQFSGRICTTSYGKVEEAITHYDDKNKKISYDAKAEKMPFFIKGLHNTWSMASLDHDKTKVNIEFKVEISSPFNLFAEFMMKSQMRKTMRLSLEELKHYIETGKPHPRNTK